MLPVSSNIIVGASTLPEKTEKPSLWKRMCEIVKGCLCCQPTNPQVSVSDKKWSLQRKADVAYGILLLIIGVALTALAINTGYAPAGIVGGLMILGGIGGIMSKGTPRPQFCS